MYRAESLPDGYYTGRGPYMSSHHHPPSGYPPHHARHPHSSHHHTYRSRGRSPLSSLGRSSVISDDDSTYDSHSRLRWILSLGLLLPALAAVIGKWCHSIIFSHSFIRHLFTFFHPVNFSYSFICFKFNNDFFLKIKTTFLPPITGLRYHAFKWILITWMKSNDHSFKLEYIWIFSWRLRNTKLVQHFESIQWLDCVWRTGVVAWAVSAEVVIGARRDSALKAADAIRLSQVRRYTFTIC